MDRDFLFSTSWSSLLCTVANHIAPIAAVVPVIPICDWYGPGGGCGTGLHNEYSSGYRPSTFTYLPDDFVYQRALKSSLLKHVRLDLFKSKKPFNFFPLQKFSYCCGHQKYTCKNGYSKSDLDSTAMVLKLSIICRIGDIIIEKPCIFVYGHEHVLLCPCDLSIT